MGTEVMTQATTLAVREEQPDSGAAFLTIIAAAARDPHVDIAKMESLLRMQENIAAKQAEMAFNQAMNRLQPKLPRIVKRGKIEFGSGDKKQSTPFARYEDIDREIRPLLFQEGFSFIFGTIPTEKGIIITATLAHSRGHSRTESMPLPLDTSGSKNAIQAVGSTMSYGKRYLVTAMLNIITEGEDNDGNGILFIDDRQAGNITDLMAACEMNPRVASKFLDFMEVKAISEIRKSDYEKATVNLREVLRKKKEAAG